MIDSVKYFLWSLTVGIACFTSHSQENKWEGEKMVIRVKLRAHNKVIEKVKTAIGLMWQLELILFN